MLSSRKHPFFIGDLCRKPRLDPRVPAAEQRARLLSSQFIQFKHRTGAYLLACSSAVGDNQFVFWQIT